MLNDAPTLQLSDIIVAVSPSPDPQPDHVSEPSRNSTPEPLQAEEIETMRRRVLELREVTGVGKERQNTREDELADMVMRLTSTPQPSSAQLVAQADTITRLIRQQEYLLDRAQEERELHEAERCGWARTSEALIGLVNRTGPNVYREHDYGKLLSSTESDNYSLRQKLSEAQNRVTILTAELAQLRPLLLMQPFALAHSHSTLDVAKPRKKKPQIIESEPTEIPEQPAPPEGDPTTPKDQQKPKLGQYYRKREEHMPLSPSPFKKMPRHPVTPKSKTGNSGPPSTTFADARSEHLLLAARKIGKERASLLGAMVYQQNKPKEEDMGVTLTSMTPSSQGPSTASPSTPKTPRKLADTNPLPNFHSPFAPSASAPGSSTSVMRLQQQQGIFQPPHSYSFVPGRGYPVYSPSQYTFSATPSSPNANASPKGRSRPTVHVPSADGGAYTFNSKAGSSSKTQTPSTRYMSNPTSSPPSRSGPPTRMDSLLSAARSVLSPASTFSDTSPSKGKGKQARLPPEHPESPTPKRRRVAPSGPSAQNAEAVKSPSSLNRTMSALDVLADQAMVFSAGPSSKEKEKSPKTRRKGRRLSALAGGAGGDVEGGSNVEENEGTDPKPSLQHDAEGKDRPHNPGHDPYHAPLAPPITLSGSSEDAEFSRRQSDSTPGTSQEGPSFLLRSAYPEVSQHEPDGVAETRHSPPVEATGTKPVAQIRTRSLAPVDSSSSPAGGEASSVRQHTAPPHASRDSRNGDVVEGTPMRPKQEDDVFSETATDQSRMATPSKGSDQVRQRWLRKLGMPDTGHPS